MKFMKLKFLMQRQWYETHLENSQGHQFLRGVFQSSKLSRMRIILTEDRHLMTAN